MQDATQQRAGRIVSDPRFKQLIASRARLRWGLSALALFMFFGFIALIVSVPEALGRDLPGTNIPVCMWLALGMFPAMVVLTGFYIWRANVIYDPLVRQVREGVGQ